MPKVRAIDAFILTHPDGYPVTVKPDQAFDPNDPLVRAHRWAFESDIETATAGPGEKRNIRR